MLARQIRRLRPGLVLLQHPDDLIFREPCSLHLPVLQEGRTLNPRGGKSQPQVRRGDGRAAAVLWPIGRAACRARRQGATPLARRGSAACEDIGCLACRRREASVCRRWRTEVGPDPTPPPIATVLESLALADRRDQRRGDLSGRRPGWTPIDERPHSLSSSE